jgi:hypothetical protein
MPVVLNRGGLERDVRPQPLLQSQLKCFYLLQSHSPQHVSAPTGHLQVERTSVIFLWCYQYYNGSVVCVILSLSMHAVRTVLYLFTVFLIMLKLSLGAVRNAIFLSCRSKRPGHRGSTRQVL